MNKIVKCFINIIIAIVCFPILLFEYFAFMWYWNCGDVFTLIAMPIVYTLCVIIQWRIAKKFKKNVLIQKFFPSLIVFLTPIITILLVELIAWIFGLGSIIV